MEQQRKQVKHTWYECPPDCDKPYCPFCRGGLGMCTVCTAVEGELTTECPGHEVTPKMKEAVYTGRFDFVEGEWKRK